MSELCQILYSEEYLSTMSQLREFLQGEVYSEEALELTEKALGLLASHYTTWHYRFNILKHLGKDWFAELDWCEVIALENEKNYQIWHYRQLVIEEILKDPASAARFDHHREYPIMNMMLEEDCKNHHVWSHRKWFVERFGLFGDEQELAYVTLLIDDDVRNNSAWTHRFFLKFGQTTVLPDVDAEIAFACNRIDLCPQNPSSWNYLKGVYAAAGRRLGELKSFCERYAGETVASSFALELLAKIAAEDGEGGEARRLYGLLALTYDPIRANYWAYVSKQVAV